LTSQKSHAKLGPSHHSFFVHSFNVTDFQVYFLKKFVQLVLELLDQVLVTFGFLFATLFLTTFCKAGRNGTKKTGFLSHNVCRKTCLLGKSVFFRCFEVKKKKKKKKKEEEEEEEEEKGRGPVM
jgi:hypothetical protein